MNRLGTFKLVDRGKVYIIHSFFQSNERVYFIRLHEEDDLWVGQLLIKYWDDDDDEWNKI